MFIPKELETSIKTISDYCDDRNSCKECPLGQFDGFHCGCGLRIYDVSVWEDFIFDEEEQIEI